MFQTILYYSVSAVNLTIRFYFTLSFHFTRHPSHIRQPEKIYSLFSISAHYLWTKGGWGCQRSRAFKPVYVNGQGIYGSDRIGMGGDWLPPPPLTCFFLEVLLVSSLSLYIKSFYLIAFPWARGALAPIKNDFTRNRFIFFNVYIYTILK